VLLLYFLLAGLGLGVALGGKPAALNAVSFRWWPLAVAGLAFQLLLFSEPVAARVGALGPALYVGSTMAVLGAILANRSLPAFRVIALGAALNLVAIAANGGLMPASADAYAALTGDAAVPSTAFTNSVVAGADAKLAFLGDIFVLPRPFPLANVFSIGDVVIGVGATLFIVRAMSAGPGPATARSATASRRAAGSLADG
jgi:hypothetical protein